MCRCKKVDASVRLTAQGLRDGLIYPRERRAFDIADPPTQTFSMPSMDDTESTVLRARTDAENELKKLGKKFPSV